MIEEQLDLDCAHCGWNGVAFTVVDKNDFFDYVERYCVKCSALLWQRLTKSVLKGN